MTNKTIRNLSRVIILIFIFAALWFCINISRALNSGSSLADAQFESFINQLEAQSKGDAFLSTNYFAKLKSLVQKNEYIAAVTIKSNDTTHFAFPLDSKFISHTSTGVDVQVSSPFIKVCSISLTFESAQNDASLVAAVRLISNNALKDAVTQSWYILLSGTVLAVILLGVALAKDGNKDASHKQNFNSKQNFSAKPTSSLREQLQEEFKKEQEQKALEQEMENAFSKDNAKNSFDKAFAKEEAFAEKAFAQDTSTFSANAQFAKDTSFAEKKSLKTNENFTQPSTSTSKTTVAEKRTIDPMGLFSQASGLSWESYLETRLDAELVRSASSEQDLSLIYIRQVGVPHAHPCTKIIAEKLIEYFKFRDLIFEFGNDGYIIIVQNTDLLHSIAICEKLYRDVSTILGEFELNCPLVMGIASRALRMLSGIRLVKEAMQAVEKALEEPELPIVAFKVNAERYRQFLTEEVSRAQV